MQTRRAHGDDRAIRREGADVSRVREGRMGVSVALSAMLLLASACTKPLPEPKPRAVEGPRVAVALSATAHPEAVDVYADGEKVGPAPVEATVQVAEHGPLHVRFAGKAGDDSTLVRPLAGAVHALALLDLPEPTEWAPPPLVDEALDTDVEVTVRGGEIQDLSAREVRLWVRDRCIIAGLWAELEGDHDAYEDVALSLVTPSGETLWLQRSSTRNPFRSYRVYAADGLEARGRWVLHVEDQLEADGGDLSRVTLRFACEGR